MHVIGIQKKSLARLPLILKELYKLESRSREVVSPAYLAEHLHQSETDVRTDLAAVGIAGSGEITCNVRALVVAIEEMLGYQNKDVFVVGTEISAAELEKSPKINSLGLKIVAVFDENAPATDKGRRVYAFSKMADLAQRMKIRKAIISDTVTAAQPVVDVLVAAGITTIFNYSGMTVKTPEYVTVKETVKIFEG